MAMAGWGWPVDKHLEKMGALIGALERGFFKDSTNLQLHSIAINSLIASHRAFMQKREKF